MSSRKNLNKYRHKWENRMVYFSIVVAIVATIAFIALSANHQDAPTWLKTVVLLAYTSPVTVTVILHYTRWKEVVDAVEVTDKQYPELYKIFKEQVKAGGFDYMPRLYVKNGNGTLNAFATKGSLNVKKSGFVVVFSDVVDTFYDLGNKDTFRFIISHELGHLKLGHINVRRNVLKGLLTPIFLKDTFQRAQEYSADRFGAAITNKIATPSLAILGAGKRNYERMNTDEYIKNDTTEISKFWVAIVNFRANHAVLRRRLAAAQRMDKEGWENVHGKML